MRDAPNDAARVTGRTDTPAAPATRRSGRSREPQTRRCIVSGITAPRTNMLRLVQGPDAQIWPDLAGRLPGRGAWIAIDRARLDKEVASGGLQAALRRAFKAPVHVPSDLSDRIESGLRQRALDRLGLEHRAGHLIYGADKLAERAAAGRLFLLLHAADASPDGSARLDQAWRVGGGASDRIISLPAGRDCVSRAVGRENVVHSGVIHGMAAARISTELRRWIDFIGHGKLTDGDLQSAGRRNDEGQE